VFCPNCRAEYRPGFTECADCGVPLVHELPQEQRGDKGLFSPDLDPDADLVPVYSTYSSTDVMLVKSLLDAEEIVYL